MSSGLASIVLLINIVSLCNKLLDFVGFAFDGGFEQSKVSRNERDGGADLNILGKPLADHEHDYHTHQDESYCKHDYEELMIKFVDGAKRFDATFNSECLMWAGSEVKRDLN